MSKVAENVKIAAYIPAFAEPFLPLTCGRFVWCEPLEMVINTRGTATKVVVVGELKRRAIQ